MTDKKIVIIGAGFAGISAGVKLMENDFENIVILEAENRIGGRVHSINYDSGKIDLGAQWVQGENNVLYEMMKNHFDFGHSPFSDIEFTFLLSNGEPADQEKCVRLSALAEKILENSQQEMRKFNGSIGDFFIEHYNKELNTAKYADIDIDLASMVMEHFHREQNGFYASPSWFDVSARLYSYSETEGEQYNTWNDKGFITAVDFVTKKLPNPLQHVDIESKVQFNKEVIRIKYSENPDEETIITCSDGSTYVADNLIITVSLGVLKTNYQDWFHPPLPDRKVQTIQNYAYGAIGKLFLEFEAPFWANDDSFIAYSLLWRDEEKNEIKSTNKAWLLDVAIFHKVDKFPNLLEMFIAGEEVRNFESISDEKLIEDIMWMLEKFLKKELPKPNKMFRTKWLTNKNFLGTYSYLGMGLQKNHVGPKELGEPLKKSNEKPFIHFAGEATDVEFPGYVHGAIKSGWRAADEVLKN